MEPTKEWDRVLCTTLGVCNQRLYEMRLQSAADAYCSSSGLSCGLNPIPFSSAEPNSDVAQYAAVQKSFRVQAALELQLHPVA